MKVLPQGWIVAPDEDGASYKLVANGVVIYEGYDPWKVWEIFWKAADCGGLHIQYYANGVRKLTMGRPGTDIGEC